MDPIAECFIREVDSRRLPAIETLHAGMRDKQLSQSSRGGHPALLRGLADPTAIKRYGNLLPVAIYADQRNEERIANAPADYVNAVGFE